MFVPILGLAMTALVALGMKIFSEFLEHSKERAAEKFRSTTIETPLDARKFLKKCLSTPAFVGGPTPDFWEINSRLPQLLSSPDYKHELHKFLITMTKGISLEGNPQYFWKITSGANDLPAVSCFLSKEALEHYFENFPYDFDADFQRKTKDLQGQLLKMDVSRFLDNLITTNRRFWS